MLSTLQTTFSFFSCVLNAFYIAYSMIFLKKNQVLGTGFYLCVSVSFNLEQCSHQHPSTYMLSHTHFRLDTEFVNHSFILYD